MAARAESAEDLDLHFQTLASVRASAPRATVLVVDDRSPAEQAQLLELACGELGCTYVMHEEGEGRAAGFNVGLTVALEHGMDACFVAPGLVFDAAGWLERLQARTGGDGEPAAVAGGVVVESDGLIRHAGYFFSAFRRDWSARLRNVPQELLEVAAPLRCPVSAELQLVRHGWIERIGGYELFGALAALDYCLRAYAAGGDCILEPTARARALDVRDAEPENDTKGAEVLRARHAGVNFSRWTPEVV